MKNPTDKPNRIPFAAKLCIGAGSQTKKDGGFDGEHALSRDIITNPYGAMGRSSSRVFFIWKGVIPVERSPGQNNLHSWRKPPSGYRFLAPEYRQGFQRRHKSTEYHYYKSSDIVEDILMFSPHDDKEICSVGWRRCLPRKGNFTARAG